MSSSNHDNQHGSIRPTVRVGEPVEPLTNHGLIINSAYSEPARYWKYDGADSLSDGELVEGHRRPAEYIKATPKNDGAELMTERIRLEVIDAIRARVKQWRKAGYEGTSPITRQLLRHWYDNEVRVHPFFFCQLEAIETLRF